MRLLALSGLVALVLLPACGDLPVEPEPEGPHALWIRHTGMVMEPGDTFTMTALMQERGSDDERPGSAHVPAESARWWTDHEDVLRVPTESRGTLEALAPGRAVLWVEIGARRDSATVTVLGEGDEPTQRWTDVSTSGSNTCALNEAGHAYCWGTNAFGGLGNGTRRFSTYTQGPVRVSAPVAFKQIEMGGNFACARTAGGEVWCWGLHHSSRLGHGQQGQLETEPVRVGFDGRAAALAVGAQHACLLDEQSRAHCWGSNIAFQLGIEEDVASSGDLGGRTVPVAFDGTFESISTHGFHTCAITPERALYCWGSVPIGSNFASAGLQTPTLVPTPTDPVDVQAANGNTCLLSDDGALYCFGGNEWGQSGHPPDDGYDEPVRTSIELRFQSIALSGGQTCGLLPGGEAWCWGGGRGLDPELTTECGLENAPSPCSPEPVAIPGGHRFQSISVSHAVCGITLDGALYCWGSNEWGQLGIGRPDIESTHIPQRVLDPL